MSDEVTAGPDTPPARTRPSRHVAVTFAAVAVTLGAVSAIVWRETRRDEIARHEILADLNTIVRKIHTHDQTLWMNVEGHDTASFDPKVEEGHQKMIADFERLSHLEDFQMLDITVHVDGDMANVRYRIAGRLRDHPCGPQFDTECSLSTKVPDRGVLYYRKMTNGWRPMSNELHEGP